MRKVLRFSLWTVIILAAVVALARATALRWWRVPEGDPYLEASIAPTLRGGDLVLLWRLTKPKPGDLVVCPEPEAPERVVIARVAAEGGDSIAVTGSDITLNNRRAGTTEACKQQKFTVAHPSTGAEVEQTCQMEVLHGRAHMRGSAAGHGVQPAQVNTIVDRGKLFLVSDNRLLTYDSREFGQVEAESCTEFVFFRLVSRAGFFDVESRMVYVR